MFASSTKALVVFFLFLLCPVLVFAGDNDWRAVTPGELQIKTPKVEPDADAEVLFWEVRVDDSDPESMAMKHYLRVKIFTERGRDKYSKVDIPFAKGIKIKDIMARVIKPDGAITELTKNEVFEREIAKTDQIKVKAKSFAVPGIETGVILEYRYQENYSYGSAEDMRMMFQHDVPIQNISYYFKPYQSAAGLKFNVAADFVKDKNGFHRVTLENVPALKKEPQMPPEDEVRSWMLVYYPRDIKDTSSDFWSDYGGRLASTWEIKDTLKPGKDIKAAATTIIGGATDQEQQLVKIYEFCKTKIKNITYDTSMTDEQKDAIKPNKSTNDTYKKLQGNGRDINELFASLTTAAGFETRLAFGGDRSEKFFNVKEAHESFIHFTGIAVNVGGRWRYFDPGSKFVPYGMLSWREEQTQVLLLGYKDYVTANTPLAMPDRSKAKRTGKFKLSEDGTLEGTVRVEYSGHLGTGHKIDNYKESANKREEMLKESVKERLSGADVSDIQVENVDDPEKPFVYTYKIKVPDYAQKTGKRMFFQPGYFKQGTSTLFTAAQRKHDIYFHYPWSEEDDVEITLPAGFVLDSADVPMPVADASGIGKLNIQVGAAKDSSFIKYQRKFSFGGKNMILFQKGVYPAIKDLFDQFHKADTHPLTLKQQ